MRLRFGLELGCGGARVPSEHGSIVSTLDDASLASSVLVLPQPAFDFDFQAANLTKDGSNRITQLNDLSGNAYHVTKAAANAPLWVASQLNGYDIGSFDTTGPTVRNLIRGGNPVNLAALSYDVVLVMRLDRAMSSNATHGLLDVVGTQGSLFISLFNTTSGIRIRSRQSSGTVTNLDAGTLSVGTWTILTVHVEASGDDQAATVEVAKDNNVQSNSGSLTYSTLDSTVQTNIGSLATTGTPAWSYAKALHFRPGLTAAERQALVRALGVKYNLSVA